MTVTHPFTVEELRQQQEALRTKYQGTQGMTIITPEYAAKLAKANEQANGIDAMLQRANLVTHRPQKATPQLLDYETARTLAWAIMQATLGQRHKTMQVDDHNKAVIQQLIRYFINDPDCELNLQKGILLTGNVGTGKTFLLDTMQALTIAAKLPSRHFRTARCVEVAELIRSGNTSDPKASGKAVTKLDLLNHGTWCFDDLGHEPLSVKVWGDDRQVMEPILVRRYNQFTAGHCITHATTNLGKQGLLDYYGPRLADRFEEMFNFILLDGDSRRG